MNDEKEKICSAKDSGECKRSSMLEGRTLVFKAGNNYVREEASCFLSPVYSEGE